MARDNVLAVAEAELEAHGIRYEVRSEGKHYKIRFTVAARNYLIVVSRTSSDHRALQNTRALVRRTIRQALHE